MAKTFKVARPSNIITLPTAREPEQTEYLDPNNERELLTLKGDLEAIFKQSAAIQTKCEDFTVRKGTTDRIFFENNRLVSYLPEEQQTMRISQIRDWPMGQLCNKIGIPFSYIKRCEEKEMFDLVTTNMNNWLDETGKDYFIREYDHNIRGLLSTRYSQLDIPEILDVIMNGIDLGELDVQGHFLSPERFHLRLTEDKKLFKKDDLFAGIQIDSSDVGRATLQVQFMIFKLVCTNGMAVHMPGSQFFMQKHIGITADVFRQNLVAALGQFDEVRERIKPMIEEAKDDVLWRDDYNDDKIPVNIITQHTALGSDQSQEIFKVMQERNYEPTRWGLVNTLTNYAQRYTLERRLEIERLAGRILAA